ncbi:MAG: ACT domain-containing protein [Clostridia bacterium]|nr:ACT domain-containing protein [Clostridia bacterium]
MRAVITVIGKDKVGILNSVSAKCAEHSVNINDVSQTIFDDLFCMIMLADITKLNVGFAEFKKEMTDLGQSQGLQIHVMHEDIFNSMHKI